MRTKESDRLREGIEEREHRVKASYTKYFVIGLVLSLLSVLIFVKTTWTATVDAAAWKGLNAHMHKGNQPTLPRRGNIFSDENTPLAISVPRYEARIDFKAGGFDADLFTAQVDSLAHHLSTYFKDKSTVGYKAHLMRGYERGSRSWKVIDREVSHMELMAMQQMPYLSVGNKNKTGFTTTRFVRRVMPYGSLAQRTIGSLKRDADSLGITHGNSGLELAFDSVLCGEPGLDRFIFVPKRWVPDPIKLPKNGMDVYTTLNVDIQDITERALRETLMEVDADWGCAVVMEVKTGAIRAMTNLDRLGEGRYGERTNHALADLLEPGSTFKSASMLAALSKGGVQPTDTVDVGNGLYRVGRGLVIKDHNAHRGGYGKITYAQAIEFSSNVGTAKAVLHTFGGESPANNRAFFDALDGMNIFDQIALEIPGTTKPYIDKNPEAWRPGAMPWISFGYQVQMPPIYTLRFYNAIANGGKMMEPYLVTSVRDAEHEFYKNGPKVKNKQIADKRSITEIQKMLRGVVTNGTGKPMDSPFVQIAGKTGTAQISGSGGYAGYGHVVTFCGYFPADDPLYSCIVVVSRPRGVYPSGSIPGKVLRAVAEQSVATSNAIPLSSYVADSTAVFTQHIGGGIRKSVKEATRLTGSKLPDIVGNGDWACYSPNDTVEIVRLKDPITSRMPYMVGMATSDAVFLAEMLGLKVNLIGKGGYVHKQSIPAERKISEGNRVTLTLR